MFFAQSKMKQLLCIFVLLVCFTRNLLCVRYYGFEDVVYLFPNIREEMVVHSIGEATTRCNNYNGANLVSIRSHNLQTFLASKLDEVYLTYSRVPDATAFLGAVTGGLLNASHLWSWPDSYVFYDQISRQPINKAYSAWLTLFGEPDTLGGEDCYHMILYSKETQLTEAWGWGDVKCSNSSNDYYVVCSKPLPNFLYATTDSQNYVINEGSNLTLFIRLFSDQYPVLLNSSLSSESITVQSNESVPYFIPYISANMTGEHFIMMVYDDVQTITTFTLDVHYLSSIELERIVDESGFFTMLHCFVSGNPTPQITWSRRNLCSIEESSFTDAVSVRESDVINLSGENRTSQRIWVEASSAAAFTCTAENPYGVINTSVHVHNETFSEVLKLSLVVNVDSGNSASLQWYPLLSSVNHSLLYAVKYQVEVVPITGSCTISHRPLLSYPTTSFSIQDVCTETRFSVKLTSMFDNCDADLNQTYYAEFYVGKTQDSSDNDGAVIALSILFVLLCILLGITCYYFKCRRHTRKYVPNGPISYLQLLDSQSGYRSLELPGREPVYSVAADPPPSTSTRGFTNSRNRVASFMRNHFYSYIGLNTETPRTDNASRTAAATSETPYEEAITPSERFYSYAGDDDPRASPTEAVYNFANEAPPESEKYATVKKSTMLTDVTAWV